MRISTATAAALLLASLTACGADPEPAAAPATPPPSPTTATATTSSPTPTPTRSKPAGPLKVGQKYRVEGDGVALDLVVLAHRRGDDYEGVQVRTCNQGDDEVGVSRGPWSLGFNDFESLHDVDITGGGLPAPEYPYLDARQLAPGECIKGWINYTRVPGERADGIQYAPPDVEPVRWAF